MTPRSIVFLTGAGISAESGLATFRGSDGLWEGHRVEDVATPEAFGRNPKLVHSFYNARRQQLLSGNVHPNPAHKALALLEEQWPGDVVIITQNVDDLHERANSHYVIHMHGELLRSRCQFCGEIKECTNDLNEELACKNCGRVGGMRPDIVWFGEMPKHMTSIEKLLREAEMFVSIGTSGKVYPAAGFVEQASYHGAKTVEINLDESERSDNFDRSIRGSASIEVPKFVDELLEN